MNPSDDNLKKYAMKMAKRARGSCPEDEILAAFVQEGLSEPEADKVLGHVCRCPACQDSIKALRCIFQESEEEGKVRVPLSFLDHAKKLDPASKSVMDIAIRFAKGVAEVIRMSGDVTSGLVPAADHVRGEGRVVSETLVTFNKQFPPYQAEIEIEKTRPDLGEITVKMTQKSGSPAKAVRVSLFDNDLELESAMVESGIAVFENLKFGKYRLEITKVGEPIGRVTLEMKGEGESK